MADQQLVGQDGLGGEVALGAVRELDGTGSIQVADQIARASLEAIQLGIAANFGALTAAANAMTIAATAEEADSAVILANVASLIAAAAQIQTQATDLTNLLSAEIVSLTEAGDLIQRMASIMQVSFGTIDEVRAMVQQLDNNIIQILGAALPLPAGILETAGAPKYDTALAVPQGVETTLVSIIVPVGLTFVIAGFVATGSVEARYHLRNDATPLMTGRTSAADRTAERLFPAGARPRAAANTTVTLTVRHPEPFTADFEGTILGYYL